MCAQIILIMSEKSPFPLIQTPHFLLRQIVATDLTQIFRGMSDPRVTEYYGISYETLELTQAQLDWFELIYETGTGIWWGICHRDEPQHLIGTCGINEWEQDDHCAEAGFWIFPEYWGKGVMLECLSAMLDYCFTKLSLHRMQSMVEPDNPASWKLIEKLGFQLEGILRECERKDDRYVDLRCYSLLAREWRSRVQPQAAIVHFPAST